MPAATVTSPSHASLQPHIRFEMRSNALFLSGAREMIAAVAKRLGFADEACGQIALAVDEALCNVIRHGYNRATDKPIWISVYAVGNGWDRPAPASLGDCQYPDALHIVIEDEARQVDPAVIRSRDLDEVRPGGLGVHIIKSIMDQVTYERREKVGMRLTMIKHRLAPGAPESPTAQGSTAPCAGTRPARADHCCGGGPPGGGHG